MKFLTTLFGFLLYFPLFSQVFVLENGSASPWSKNVFLTGELSESFSKLDVAITAIQSEEKVCIVDSLVLQIQTNPLGEIDQIKTAFSLSNKHKERIVRELNACRFQPNAKFKLLFLFPPKHHAPDLFELEKTPRIGTCRRVETNYNPTFDLACFNYHVEEKIKSKWGESLIDVKNQGGLLSGRITFDENGDVVQIAFSKFCFNPVLNDLIAENSDFSVKKGAAFKGEPSGFTLDLISIFYNVNDNDSNGILALADKCFENNAYDSALFYYATLGRLGKTLDTIALIRFGYTYYQLGLHALAQEVWERVIGPTGYDEVIEPGFNENGIELTKHHQTKAIPTFKNCAGLDSIHLFDCFNESLTKHVEENINFYLPREYHVDTLAVRVAFSVEADGSVSNVYLPFYNSFWYSNYVLRAFKAVCRLSPFQPCKNSESKCVEDYIVPIVFYKYQD